LSSPSAAGVDCESIRNNLRAYLEKWWKAGNEADYVRFGKKAQQTYIKLQFDCQEGALQTYTKMLEEVQKLPKGPYLREVDAKEKAGHYVKLQRQQAPPP
jgi:hypothetical protein